MKTTYEWKQVLLSGVETAPFIFHNIIQLDHFFLKWKRSGIQRSNRDAIVEMQSVLFGTTFFLERRLEMICLHKAEKFGRHLLAEVINIELF